MILKFLFVILKFNFNIDFFIVKYFINDFNLIFIFLASFPFLESHVIQVNEPSIMKFGHQLILIHLITIYSIHQFDFTIVLRFTMHFQILKDFILTLVNFNLVFQFLLLIFIFTIKNYYIMSVIHQFNFTKINFILQNSQFIN